MERDFSVRISLVVVATLLMLYLITLLLLNPLPSYGKLTIQYVVVDQRAQSANWDRTLSGTQNLERILNQYGSQGWRLISRLGPENSLIFANY